MVAGLLRGFRGSGFMSLGFMGLFCLFGCWGLGCMVLGFCRFSFVFFGGRGVGVYVGVSGFRG